MPAPPAYLAYVATPPADAPPPSVPTGVVLVRVRGRVVAAYLPAAGTYRVRRTPGGLTLALARAPRPHDAYVSRPGLYRVAVTVARTTPDVLALHPV